MPSEPSYRDILQDTLALLREIEAHYSPAALLRIWQPFFTQSLPDTGDQMTKTHRVHDLAQSIAERIGTTARLFAETVDAAWVKRLEAQPELAERTDAFATRFGRMRDTLGDKLIPELRRQLLETPGATLDNLNRMEKLGLLASVTDWVEARNLRNRLIHEYMRDEAEFASALNRVAELTPRLWKQHFGADPLRSDLHKIHP